MTRVASDTVVRFRYVMKDSSGQVLEDTREAPSTVYLHGGTTIDAKLQLQFSGLQAGDRKSLVLPSTSKDSADDYYFDVTIDAVRAATEQEIILGYPVEADCLDDCDCYNTERKL